MAEKTVMTPDEEFEAAFAEATSEADAIVQGAPAATEAAPAPVTETPAPAAKAAEEKPAPADLAPAPAAKAAEEKPTPAADTPTPAAKAAEETPAEPAPAAPAAPDPAAIAQAAADRALAQQAEAQVARARADAEAAAAAERARVTAEETAKALAPYKMTPEEAAADAKFKEDFPNEWLAMDARRKAMEQEINLRVRKAVDAAMERVSATVQPMVEAQDAITQERFRERVLAKHADFDTHLAALPDWIKTQPQLLQISYVHAYNNGTPEMVADLLTAYKTSKGIDAAPAAAATSAAAPAAAAPAVQAAKAAAAADAAVLAPVATKRTVAMPAGKGDPNDYEAAFAEAPEG